jgi:hypothetical protein
MNSFLIKDILYSKNKKIKLKMSSILLDDSKIKELDKRLTMVTNNQFLYYFKLIFIYNTFIQNLEYDRKLYT